MNRKLLIFWGVLVLALLLDLAFEHKSYFGFDGLIGFHAVYGFVAAAVLVGAARLLGLAVRRGEDYDHDR